MTKLEDAILLATQAHAGTQDKSGAPYILHPLRLMFKMKTESEMIVAILHDVVEDTDWTLPRLRDKGFSEDVIFALDCLTKRDSEDYEEFIKRIKPNALARRVKLADIEDNMDIKRLPILQPKDSERLVKYHKAWLYLTAE